MTLPHYSDLVSAQHTTIKKVKWKFHKRIQVNFNKKRLERERAEEHMSITPLAETITMKAKKKL